MIKIKWLKSCKTTILNTYAPYDRDIQPEFWATAITNRHTLHAPLPDFVLGDFNLTEDSIDRVPAHFDDDAASEALREVCQVWNI
jgi:hypothetical protein